MILEQLKKRWSSLQKGKIGCAMFLFNNARGGGWPCSLHRQIVIIKKSEKNLKWVPKREKRSHQLSRDSLTISKSSNVQVRLLLFNFRTSRCSKN